MRDVRLGLPSLSIRCLTVAALAIGAGAQQPPASQPTDAGGAAPDLRAELAAAKPMYVSDGPIWLRLALTNTTDQPLGIPLAPYSAADGIRLADELIFGSAQEPGLTVSTSGEPPRPIPLPPTLTAAAATLPPGAVPIMLRIAPRGMLGAEIDLRDYYPQIRYSGNYHVEWRPLGARGPVGMVDFRVEARKNALLFTDLPGRITFKLDYEGAPLNVQNFLELVQQEFYNGTVIHRLIPGYILQGGKPKGETSAVRPDGKLVPAELRNLPVEPGTLMMARRLNDPNSASCQFVVALARRPELDGQFTVIGRADDPESLRLLQQLAETPVDAQDRPVKTLFVRSINLVDAESSLTRHIELRPPGAAATQPATPQTVSERPADRP